MARTILAGLIYLTALGGCSKRPESRVGQTTPEGNLIFFEWDGVNEKKHAVLRDGYGMMIFYDAYAKKPVARYELYIHKDARIIRTTDLARFRSMLAEIPAGERLHYYNTCAGGTHHGLDPIILAGIRVLCDEKDIVVQEGDDEVFVICTCL